MIILKYIVYYNHAIKCHGLNFFRINLKGFLSFLSVPYQTFSPWPQPWMTSLLLTADSSTSGRVRWCMCILNSYQRRALESSGLEVYVHISFIMSYLAVLQHLQWVTKGTQEVQQLGQTHVKLSGLVDKSKLSRKAFGKYFIVSKMSKHLHYAHFSKKVKCIQHI